MTNKKVVFNPEIHKPRDLTKKELRLLRDSGFHPNYVKDPGKTVDEMTDFILNTFYLEIDFQYSPNRLNMKFATDHFKLAYGVEETETKNSQRSGIGIKRDMQRIARIRLS